MTKCLKCGRFTLKGNIPLCLNPNCSEQWNILRDNTFIYKQDYKTQEFKEMIMTYDDKTLETNK